MFESVAVLNSSKTQYKIVKKLKYKSKIQKLQNMTRKCDTILKKTDISVVFKGCVTGSSPVAGV